MSYQMPKRPVHIDSYENNGNLLNPSEKYVCIRLWLPEGAPAEVLSENWPDGKEPNIDREPPSAVVELISEKLERAWIDTSREKKREIIAWCRQNAAMLDRQWVEELIRREERTIARAQRKIVQLQNELDVFHYELHVSASSLSEWGALQEDETLCSKEVTTLGGTEMRVLRFHSPVEAAEYGQPVLLIIRPHGKHCGCRPVYDFQGLR